MYPLGQIRFVLASASPRRKELLHHLGVRFEIVESMFEEEFYSNEKSNGAALRLADGKACDVFSRLSQSPSEGSPPLVVLGADTIVAVHEADGKDTLLGKPANSDEVRQMLSRLSGRTHTVVTGLVLKGAEGVLREAVETKVTFSKLSSADIEWYIAANNWQGLAGGYAIQGVAGVLIEKVEGCISNVVGLSLPTLRKMLENISDIV